MRLSWFCGRDVRLSGQREPNRCDGRWVIWQPISACVGDMCPLHCPTAHVPPTADLPLLIRVGESDDKRERESPDLLSVDSLCICTTLHQRLRPRAHPAHLHHRHPTSARGYMRDYPMQLNATASLIQQQYVQSTAQPAGGAGRAPGGPGRTPLAGRAMAQFGAAPRVGMFSAAPLRFVDTPFLENIVELATPVRLDCNQDYGPVHKYLRMQMSHAAVMATTLNPRLRPYLRCGKLENGVLISSFPRMIRWVCGGTAISEVAQARYCPIEISKYIPGWRLAGKIIQFEILQANRFDPVDNSVLQTYAAQVRPRSSRTTLNHVLMYPVACSHSHRFLLTCRRLTSTR